MVSEAAGEDYARLQTNGTWADATSGGNHALVIEWDANEVLSGFTFNLTDDAGGRFAIDPSTGELTVADGSLIDSIAMGERGADNQRCQKCSDASKYGVVCLSGDCNVFPSYGSKINSFFPTCSHRHDSCLGTTSTS